MAQTLEVLSWIFLVTGSFFVIVGGIGLLRLPDFYTRIHAASVTDTVGSWLVLIGLTFQAGQPGDSEACIGIDLPAHDFTAGQPCAGQGRLHQWTQTVAVT